MFSYSNLWSGYGPFNWGIVAELANLWNLKDAMSLFGQNCLHLTF